ncbi:NADPH:quinone reductase-like Zn-dependent oxidoreductase [Kribbella sp. VKM Ac-2527]|uniref:NADPH:quinone reductase-like Zn-dependent oxidoreductase n=1 Tax=Kribbella caucasensis TaxID=2512215 RepID=A0A4V3C9R6_9ACTN|nr:zinc-binding dehydrogenase [Kribbella sp. VKM Ac-2527]TDO46849.1 NADPH:quinone reductase-like Zn-dependent oxidoreductase [Kribbella sp. VKM Ac-2527]
MRAVVQTRFGGPEVLQPAEVPDPVPERTWAVVRLKASALNWHDVLVRQGRYNSPLPHIPGADGAGVDIETGEDVLVLPSLWWGDDESAPGPRWEILGDHRPGTYAEFVKVPRECVVPKPSGLSWPEAAALPLVGLTTYRALFSRARLKAGESVLVSGAGGGVATMAVSLAAAAGCQVIVTSSSEEKIARARELGAAAGVLYADPGWPEAAKELTPHGFDVVLDSVGSWGDSLSALRPGGRLVVLGASRADRAVLDVRPFYFGQFELIGTTMGSPRDFAGLLRFLEEYDVSPPVVDRVFPLDEASAAHGYLESGQGFGKVVLSP